jgi:predicted metal-dependent hydrolase
MSLRVSALDGRVTLSLPRRACANAALAFAEEKSDWIRGHLARRPDPVTVGIGARIPVAGQELPIVAGQLRRAERQGDALIVPDAPSMAAACVKAWLKLQARAALAPACGRYAAALGRVPGRITLRDTRSRWGSCTARGDLMFSWRLVMAPSEVLDYVAAHEVAHLVEMNHSPAYWAVVERICPDYRAPRAWLKAHGQDLHRYRFGD